MFSGQYIIATKMTHYLMYEVGPHKQIRLPRRIEVPKDVFVLSLQENQRADFGYGARTKHLAGFVKTPMDAVIISPRIIDIPQDVAMTLKTDKELSGRINNNITHTLSTMAEPEENGWSNIYNLFDGFHWPHFGFGISTALLIVLGLVALFLVLWKKCTAKAMTFAVARAPPF
jgi:hypothetical protein